MDNFIAPLAGGAIIGLAAVWMLLSLGRIAGISGILATALKQPHISPWAVFFVLGLGLGGFMASLVVDINLTHEFSAVPLATTLIGGLLVGFGTRMGSGCTSGHGVCGISRFSVRSLTATVTFLLVGMLTATLVGML